MSDIVNKSILKTTTTKHHIDYEECDVLENEFPMYKAQRLNFEPFEEIDFDVEAFIESINAQSTITPIVVDKTALTSKFGFCKESCKILDELNRICDAPIEKISVEEDEIILKEIQKISNELKATTPVFMTFEKRQAIFIDNLRILFNSLVFKNYDFSNGKFNPDSETILYEHLYKVNVYIKTTEALEFSIYFGFPFYVSIHINVKGKIFISRNDIYQQLENRDEIAQIHYYATNTGFNILDVITTYKFINLILTKYFISGFDLFSILMHTLEQYKQNSDINKFNKIKLNFERFVQIYKQIITNIELVPIR